MRALAVAFAQAFIADLRRYSFCVMPSGGV